MCVILPLSLVTVIIFEYYQKDSVVISINGTYYTSNYDHHVLKSAHKDRKINDLTESSTKMAAVNLLGTLVF